MIVKEHGMSLRAGDYWCFVTCHKCKFSTHYTGIVYHCGRCHRLFDDIDIHVRAISPKSDAVIRSKVHTIIKLRNNPDCTYREEKHFKFYEDEFYRK